MSAPTGARPGRWAQADLREPKIDHHDERTWLVLQLLGGAFGACAMVFGAVGLLAWAAGLLK